MQSDQCIVVKDTKENVVGYGLSIQTPENKIIGPVVAKNEEIAMRIVHDLAKGHNGKLRIDVLEGKKDFMKVLESSGFKKVNTPPIMLKNSGQLLKRNNELYSIAAQILDEKNPSERRILFVNHDIDCELAERGLPRYPHHRKIINIVMTMENFIMVRDNLFCSQYVRISCGMTVLINVTSNPCTVAVLTAVSIQCSVLHPPITIWLIFSSFKSSSKEVL